jgi:hypothetical protein
MNQEAQSRQFSQIIAKSWADDGFKKRLLSDPVVALKAEGFEIPSGVSVQASENTDKVINLVLPPKPTGEGAQEIINNVAAGPKVLSTPTLSNYLFPIPGCGKAIARAWNDAAFKQQFLTDPEAALKNTGNVFHLVLPLKPSDELSDEHLEAVSGGLGINTAIAAKSLGRPGVTPVGFGCACACCCCCVCCC